jgi:hypothetical protein
MLRWPFHHRRRLGPYDTISGRWFEYGRVHTDGDETWYPSEAAQRNDPVYLRGASHEVIRDRRGDQVVSDNRRSWVGDKKALRGED